MAKNDKVRMPSSMAGITQYFEGDESKIMITPKQAMVAIVAVSLVVLGMHAFL